jgi:hypothetical protein
MGCDHVRHDTGALAPAASWPTIRWAVLGPERMFSDQATATRAVGTPPSAQLGVLVRGDDQARKASDT